MAKSGIDFKHKEVISVIDGRRLGFIQDINADLESGKITSIIVPGSSKKFNFITAGEEMVIPWEKIKHIGDEIILVEV